MSKINLDSCRYTQACIGNGEVEVIYTVDDVVVGIDVVANGTTEGENMGDLHSRVQYYYDTDELVEESVDCNHGM